MNAMQRLRASDRTSKKPGFFGKAGLVNAFLLERLRLASVLALLLAVVSGCGQNDASSKTADPSGGLGSDDSLPSASIGAPEEFHKASPPPKGSPEWILGEIRNLRAATIDTGLSADEIEKARTEQQEAIIKLATEAIALTHADAAKEAVFDEAVRQLMQSRLELALSDAEAVDDLYEDRDMLYKRDPKSKAAAEAAFVVARFAHTKARDFAKQEPRWLDEFSRQARAFAASFPGDEGRAVPLLYAAGWSCELNGRRDEAVSCYSLLRENFPKSPQGQQIVAVLRRLQMVGKPVELAGPTLDGSYLAIDKYAGKVVLVVFWASDNSQFRLVLPKLIETVVRYEKHGLAVIGVSLDEDQQSAEAFIKVNELDWPQIFDSDPAKRRWKNDVVKYYGIRNIPLVWLIDRRGIVADAQVDLGQLDEQIRSLLGRRDAEPQ